MTDAELDLAYLAGVIDDSCCITIRQRTDRMSRPRMVLLEMKRADRALLDIFAATFGGKVTRWSARGKDFWRWSKVGKSAQDVIRQLRPYLRVCAKEADRALSVAIGNKGTQRFRPKPGNWKDLESRA